MNSASPMPEGSPISPARSAASIRAPEVSISVEGTQDESCTRRSISRCGEACWNQRMPSTPRTLAISCGSQIAVVIPRGVTQRSNSCGVTRLLSTWRWVSMNPGTSTSPATSTTSAAS